MKYFNPYFIIGPKIKNFHAFNVTGGPDTFSNIANNYIADHKLKLTPQHLVYSLRHTFKDRLKDIGAPEEPIDGLMEHKEKGPQYGRGHRLEQMHEWLQKVAYQIPEAER